MESLRNGNAACGRERKLNSVYSGNEEVSPPKAAPYFIRKTDLEPVGFAAKELYFR
jgi:hypothetical protein